MRVQARVSNVVDRRAGYHTMTCSARFQATLVPTTRLLLHVWRWRVRKHRLFPTLHLRDVLGSRHFSKKLSLSLSAEDLQHRSAWSIIWPLTTRSTNSIMLKLPVYLLREGLVVTGPLFAPSNCLLSQRNERRNERDESGKALARLTLVPGFAQLIALYDVMRRPLDVLSHCVRYRNGNRS